MTIFLINDYIAILYSDKNFLRGGEEKEVILGNLPLFGLIHKMRKSKWRDGYDPFKSLEI